MTNPHLINFEQLKSWTGYESKAAIIKWLDDQGIKYRLCKGVPVTSVNCLVDGDGDAKTEWEFSTAKI